MLPFLAQGAGMAIEDAAVLGVLHEGTISATPEAGLRAYESARAGTHAERAQQIITQAGHAFMG